MTSTALLFSDFEPRFLYGSSLSHLVVGSNEERGQYTTRQTEPKNERVDAYPISKFSSWNSSISWTDIKAVLSIYSKPETHYGDLKRIIISDGNQGSRISLTIQVDQAPSKVWLCELNIGLKVKTVLC